MKRKANKQNHSQIILFNRLSIFIYIYILCIERLFKQIILQNKDDNKAYFDIL